MSLTPSNPAPGSPVLPLSGIRVVELSHMVMGPTCGMILGDLGAEVIKVEPPHGDGTRRLLGAGAGFFRTFNRNKKSVALDLDSEAGRAALRRLVDGADVFLENFKPGRMTSLGLDYDSVHARNPKLIYVSHKGFLNGPYENRLALDEVVQMMAGLAYMTGPIGRPLRAGSSVNDIMGGMFGAIGVLAALHERERTGLGREVQSALFENCVLLSAQHMQQYAVTGVAPDPMPARISAWAVYDIFELKDGEQMFIAATGDSPWRALCAILQRDDLVSDPRLATNNDRVLARSWLLPVLSRSLRDWTGAELVPLFEQNQIPFAAITRPQDLFDDPHLLQSGGLAPLTLDDGSETRVPLLPITLDGARMQARAPIAKIGEHTAQVLAEIGYSQDEIAAATRNAAAGAQSNAA